MKVAAIWFVTTASNNNNITYNYGIMHDSERAVCGGDT